MAINALTPTTSPSIRITYVNGTPIPSSGPPTPVTVTGETFTVTFTYSLSLTRDPIPSEQVRVRILLVTPVGDPQKTELTGAIASPATIPIPSLTKWPIGYEAYLSIHLERSSDFGETWEAVCPSHGGIILVRG